MLDQQLKGTEEKFLRGQIAFLHNVPFSFCLLTQPHQIDQKKALVDLLVKHGALVGSIECCCIQVVFFDTLELNSKKVKLHPGMPTVDGQVLFEKVSKCFQDKKSFRMKDISLSDNDLFMNTVRFQAHKAKKSIADKRFSVIEMAFLSELIDKNKSWLGAKTLTDKEKEQKLA